VSKLEDALWEADAALKRCKPEQGRVARNNARRAMLRSLRKARTALDAEFPVIPKTRKRPVRRSVKQRLRGKSRVGLKEMMGLVKLGVAASGFLTIGDSVGGNSSGTTVNLHYAPSWMVRALNAKLPPKLIADAVRSQKKRRQINAMLRLSGRGKTP